MKTQNIFRLPVWVVGRLMLASMVLIALAGCDRSPDPTPATANAGGPTPARIVCTVGMVTDIVKQVASDRANVTGIIGEGVDPHLYKATRNDVAALMNADVLFYSGLLLEGKMTETIERIAAEGKPVFAVTERIDPSFLLDPADGKGHHDPHVWMAVSGWMKAVEAVAEALSKHDPAGASTYQANSKRYLTELQALHDYAKRALASIPERQRVLVTAHDAFQYFGREYGIEVLGIQGISTESEAGLQDINRLVSLIVEREVKAVFVETSVAEKNIRALIDGAGARGKNVKVGGSLFSDAMGAPGTYEGTYLGMIDHNVTTITRALGGDAPERGMQGKLSVSR